jgi:predicted DNA-binding transcriptional regulator AlpA
MEAELITTSEFARRVRVTPHTIYRWRRQGYGPRAIKVGPRALRYSAAEVTAWLGGRFAA